MAPLFLFVGCVGKVFFCVIAALTISLNHLTSQEPHTFMTDVWLLAAIIFDILAFSFFVYELM